jgi:quinoprotein glucose dehydrogenase
MFSPYKNYSLIFITVVILFSCDKKETKSNQEKKIDPAVAKQMAATIESSVKPELAEGLTIRLWGVDSLVADPVSIDIDDNNGDLYYTRTIRQQHSEFDIRGHQDWEIQSIKLQTIEDKRAFLHSILSPENSAKNTWLADLNNDSSHDWRDMTIEREPVYRLRDLSGDGIADASQVVIQDFHEEVTDAMGGILKTDDDLYVAIGPDLWRIKDKDGDGIADEKVSLSHGYGIHIGFGGHGMSGVEMGPDGRIYWQIGDIGFNGTGPDGTKWENPNNGVIVRSEPDGSNFEVFAYGNRNTHEFVFDEYANMISEDNDGDQPGERERIVYVVNGADFGWRINWQFGKYRDPDNNTYRVWTDEKLHIPRFPTQAAYIIPTIANYVNGPTGMLYNPGTALNEKWNKTFFIVEFVGNPAQSGIHTFKLNPEGAGFKLGETGKMLGGVLATGIDFGPDGAMYVADWIDGWGTKKHGRIWKLDVDHPDAALRKATQELLTADFSKYSEQQLEEILQNPDMRVRQKSQFELAKRGDKGLNTFTHALAESKNQLARVHSIWGISQFARKDVNQAKHLVSYLNDNDPEIRAQAAKWIGDVRFKEAGKELVTLLTNENDRTRFFAAEALGRIGYEPAINSLIQLLADNDNKDVYIRHAASLALARINKPSPIVALSSHSSQAVRLGAVLALRRMRNEGIKNFLTDKDSLIVMEVARAINDDLSITAALPALGDLLNTTEFTNEPLVRRAIGANVRVGNSQSLQNLINYASKSNQPVALRSEALEAIATWEKPSVLDRVDGRYRGEVTHDLKEAKPLVEPIVVKLLNDKKAPVRVSALRVIEKFKTQESLSALNQLLRNDPSPEVRAESLKALVAVTGGKNITESIKLALKDKEKSVRALALDFLPKMDVPHDLMISSLLDVIQTRSVEERQSALLTLAGLPVAETKPAFEKILAKYKAKQLPTEVYLELEEAIDSTKSSDLIGTYKSIAATASADTLFASYASALSGGNVNKGARIFYQHESAQCIRCHALGDMGGSAGPPLDAIASKLTPKQRLEALIDPSSRLSPGYGSVSATLANGKKIDGILAAEDASTLTIKRGNLPDTVIEKKSIREKTMGVSSMPPMRYLLTKKEIRDVMSFLEVLKTSSH